MTAEADKVAKITIILKQDNFSKFKIGDVIVGSEKNTILSSSWKLAAV